jgi:hypothetical protein
MGVHTNDHYLHILPGDSPENSAQISEEEASNDTSNNAQSSAETTPADSTFSSADSSAQSASTGSQVASAGMPAAVPSALARASHHSVATSPAMPTDVVSPRTSPLHTPMHAARGPGDSSTDDQHGSAAADSFVPPIMRQLHVARLLLLIRSYGTIFWDFLLRPHLQYHLLLPLELKLACKKVHVIRKNILMVLSDMLYSHLHENQQNLLRLYLIQIGSMSCKMNMMLLFPTTPGTWCPQLHQKYY